MRGEPISPRILVERGAIRREGFMVFAYIDPGAGSLLIQAVIAGIVSVPFLLRSQLRSVLGRFRKAPATKPDTDSSTTGD
jgi:hypothetical protein